MYAKLQDGRVVREFMTEGGTHMVATARASSGPDTGTSSIHAQLVQPGDTVTETGRIRTAKGGTRYQP